ncbi:hypothetical protein RIF29_39996 [Crotalaria pallida]|uniref:Uncharacterized protein n=1 Tax=Crotalaria pallida TaxID=3830 RepID=A0AAN9HQA2_CROPI
MQEILDLCDRPINEEDPVGANMRGGRAHHGPEPSIGLEARVGVEPSVTNPPSFLDQYPLLASSVAKTLLASLNLTRRRSLSSLSQAHSPPPTAAFPFPFAQPAALHGVSHRSNPPPPLLCNIETDDPRLTIDGPRPPSHLRLSPAFTQPPPPQHCFALLHYCFTVLNYQGSQIRYMHFLLEESKQMHSFLGIGFQLDVAVNGCDILSMQGSSIPRLA